ncbi:conserved serine-threonine rich protein [Histoplasma ohiense]|nr:conserved serine-threonine rich protein [Histoplasma ohiense (nom. inval.)]
MASSSLSSWHRSLQHLILPYQQLLAPAIPSTSETFRSQVTLYPRQQRSLLWWSRRHDPKWLSEGKSRLQKLIQKEKESQSFYKKYVSRGRRRRPYIYQSWAGSKFYFPHEASRVHRRRDVSDELAQGMGKGNRGEKSWLAKERPPDNGFEDPKGPGGKNSFDSWGGKKHEFGESMRHESEKWFEAFKKAVNRDPYGFIFGRRMQPFPFGLKHGSWLSFYHSLFAGEGPTDSRPRPGSPADIRNPPTEEGAESRTETSSEININGDRLPSSNTVTDAAFEFDPISGRMVPARNKTISNQAGDSSPIILSNPRDGEAEMETRDEQENSNQKPNIDIEEPLVLEPEHPVSSKMILPNDANDQTDLKSSQTLDTEGPGTIETKQPAANMSVTDNDTTEAHSANVGKKADTEQIVSESNQPDSAETALGKDVKDTLKSDGWALNEPEKPEGAAFLASTSEEANTTTFDAKNKTPMHKISPLGEEDEDVQASDWQSHQYLIAKAKKSIENSGRLPKELEGMSHSDYLRYLESLEAPNASPLCEIYQKAYDIRDDSRTEENVDQLRASDIRASYKTWAERHGVEEAYGALQDTDCGLDVDELRWKLRQENRTVSKVETGRDSVSSATEATEPAQKVMNLLFRDDTTGTERSKVTHMRNVDGVDDASTTVSSSKRDGIHPIFGIKTTDANRHCEIGNIARELRAIKEATVSMNALLTGQHSPSGTTADVLSAAPSERMAIEERETQVAQISEILSDVKNVNTSMASILAELGEDVQRKKSTREEDAGKSRLDQNVEAKNSSSRSNPSQYRILVYDSLTMEVKEMGISAGHSGSGEIPQLLHPTEALSRLSNPSRFLEHLPLLEAQGFEIVSGGGDILIFKKVKGSERKLVDDGEHVARTLKASIPDVTAANQNSSDAYGDGGDTVHSPVQASQLGNEVVDQIESSETLKGNPTGREASHVFDQGIVSSFDSGATKQQQQQEGELSTPHPPKSEKAHPFLRKALRRILLTGGVAAGMCYALGVVVEYFRTGGQDGLGPQGFTGLEGR